MTTRKKVLKVFIILILVVFLISTGLVSVLYLGGKKGATGTGDVLTGDAATGTVIETGADLTGSAE